MINGIKRLYMGNYGQDKEKVPGSLTQDLRLMTILTRKNMKKRE